MRIYFINPIGYSTPLLFETFIPTFIKKGHDIVNEVKDADVVFFDMHSRIGKYDMHVLKKVLEKQVPVVFFDAWDYGAMSKESFPYLEHEDIKWFMLCISVLGIPTVYFVRKLSKAVAASMNVYPYELIMYPDHDFEPVSKDELCSREIDICFIGNTSPTRYHAVRDLLAYREFGVYYQLGAKRISHDEWLNWHRKSKLFLEACGGGFGSERPFQLMTISPMLRVRRNQLTPNDFIDGDDCIEINENVSKEDVIKLRNFLNDDDKLYSIYLKGIERMKTYFNAEYRANYILDVLKENNIA